MISQEMILLVLLLLYFHVTSHAAVTVNVAGNHTADNLRVRISSTQTGDVIVHRVSDGVVEVPEKGKMEGLMGNIQMIMASCSIEEQADIVQWSFANANSRFLRVNRNQQNGTDSGKAAVLLMFDLSKATLQGTLTFSVYANQSVHVYRRTGESRGMIEHGYAVLDDIVVQVNASQYQETPNVHEYLVVTRETGARLRLKRLTLDIQNDVMNETVEKKGKAEPKQGPKFFSLFTNNMMLQRDATVAVYGTADLNATLVVTFANQTVMSVADSSSGFWIAHLDPMPASRVPETLSVTDGSSTASVKNVLVGDVWLAGGQSNMDRPFKLYKSLNASGIFNPRIRLLDIPDNLQKEPVDLDPAIDTSWQTCQSDFLENFSPAAYFFADKVERELKVPVGIILSASGASKIERWTPANVFTDLGYPPDAPGNQVNFNGMIYPLRNFTIKGILWYQGESNADQPEQYTDLFRGLITSWRTLFGNPYLPFYFAQLASFGTRSTDKTDTKWAFLREAQEKALNLPGTRMIVLTDAGEYSELHPEDKLAVGERFARHALVDSGVTGMNVDNPSFLSMEIKTDSVLLTFDHVGDGLETREVRMNKARGLAPGTDPNAFVVPDDELRGFSIAGSDQVFVEAVANITSSNQVTVWSEYVSNPVAVRYCFSWFGLCNLYASNDGLVAKPFRTDYFSLPSFNGDTLGDLFDGDFQVLGLPMNLSLSTGPSTISSLTMKGIEAYQAAGGRNSSLREMYYSASSFSEFLNGPYVIVKIVYFDKGSKDDIRMRYSGRAKSSTSVSGPIQILLQNTLTWRVATAVLTDAVFDQSFLNNDLRLQSTSKNLIINGVYLSGVTSMLQPTLSPTIVPSGEELYPSTMPTSAETPEQSSSSGTPNVATSPTQPPSMIGSGAIPSDATTAPSYRKTLVPTSRITTTGSSNTAIPTTEVPQSEIPTTTIPSLSAASQMPTTGAPALDSGKVATGTTLMPTPISTIVPTTELSMIGTLTIGTPTNEIPTSAAPSTAIPNTITPTSETPTSNVPTTFVPTTVTTTTVMPTSSAPISFSPTTVMPTSSAPISFSPTTVMPTSSAPISFSPTTLIPTSSAPNSLIPTTITPTIDTRTQWPTASADYYYQSDLPSVIPTVDMAVNTGVPTSLSSSTLSPDDTTTLYPTSQQYHFSSEPSTMVPTSWDTLNANGYASDTPSTNPPIAWQGFSSTPTTAPPNNGGEEGSTLSVYWIDPSMTRVKDYGPDELSPAEETNNINDSE